MNNREQLTGTEGFGAHLFESPSLELQNHLIEQAKSLLGMSEAEWVEKYSENFRTIFEDKDKNIYQKFKSEAYDKNPTKFLENLQQELDKM